MSGKRCAGTEKAIKLVKKGYSGLQAAKKAGIHHTTLYRDDEYKAYRAEKAQKSSKT